MERCKCRSWSSEFHSKKGRSLERTWLAERRVSFRLEPNRKFRILAHKYLMKSWSFGTGIWKARKGRPRPWEREGIRNGSLQEDALGPGAVHLVPRHETDLGPRTNLVSSLIDYNSPKSKINSRKACDSTNAENGRSEEIDDLTLLRSATKIDGTIIMDMQRELKRKEKIIFLPYNWH